MKKLLFLMHSTILSAIFCFSHLNSMYFERNTLRASALSMSSTSVKSSESGSSSHRRVDPNTCDKAGFTPLYKAAKAGDVVRVKLLLAAGARPNDTVLGRWTALDVATAQGNEQVIELLISYGADVTSREMRGWTPLYAAAAQNKNDLVKALLDAGAYADEEVKGKATPLLVACYKGYTDVVASLLNAGADPTKPAKLGYFTGLNPLHASARGRHTQVASLLLNAGANPHDVIEAGNCRGFSALHYAAMYGSVEIINLLLDAYADTQAMTSNKHTPLDYALMYGQLDAARQLIKRGAHFKIISPVGKVPLEIALAKRAGSLIRLLVKAGAKIDSPTALSPFYSTPLLKALVTKNKTDFSDELIRLRKIVCAPQNRACLDEVKEALLIAYAQGMCAEISALHELGALSEGCVRKILIKALAYAVSGGDAKLVKELLSLHGSTGKAGCPVNLLRELLRRAVINQHRDVVSLLLNAGAPVDASITFIRKLKEMRGEVDHTLIDRAEKIEAMLQQHHEPNSYFSRLPADVLRYVVSSFALTDNVSL